MALGCQAMSEGLVTGGCQRANGPLFTILGNNHTVRLSSCLSCRHGIHCYGLMDLMGGALRSGVRIRCHFPNQTACTMLFFLQCLQVTPAYVLRSSRFFLPRCLGINAIDKLLRNSQQSLMIDDVHVLEWTCFRF